MPLILVVDDEADIRDSIQEYLTLHGFTVATADGGAAMRACFAERKPDLVVLDLRMPGEDGLVLARWLRANTSVGILMLTAVSEPIDRVVGLEIGADDYMTKPFDLRELLARVKTVLRRTVKPIDAARHVRLGRCWLDVGTHRLHFDDGTHERLSKTEFDLLHAFVRNPRRVLTRDDLLSVEEDADVFDRSIDVRISRLRRKIEKDADNPQVIRTMRGAGYIFEPGEVNAATPRPP